MKRTFDGIEVVSKNDDTEDDNATDMSISDIYEEDRKHSKTIRSRHRSPDQLSPSLQSRAPISVDSPVASGCYLKRSEPAFQGFDGYHEKVKSIQELMENTNSGPHEKPSRIQEKLGNIECEIWEAFTDFFSDTGLESLTQLDALGYARSSQRLADLLSLLFGSGIIVNTHGNLAARPRVRRFAFVSALAGAAVTSWALTPQPQGDVRTGLLGKLTHVLKETNQSVYDQCMEIAVRDHLEDNIKLRVPKSAYGMSHELLDLLEPLMKTHRHRASLRSARSLYLPEHEIPNSGSSSETIEVGSERSVAIDDPPSQASRHWPLYNSTSPITNLTYSLESIFQAALNLRIGMESKGNAEYSFHLPFAGQDFSSELHVVHDLYSNAEISLRSLEQDGQLRRPRDQADTRPSVRIMLPLTPIVKARYRLRSDRNEDWDPQEVVVAQAHVFVGDHANQAPAMPPFGAL